MTRLQVRRFSAVAPALVALLAATAGPARAQTWVGGGGNNLWTTNANWSSGAFPTTGADIVFDGSTSAQLSNVMGAPFTVKSLAFTPGQTQSVTISTGTDQPLTFNTSGTILNVQSGSHTFTGTNSAGSGTPYCWFLSGTGSAFTYTYNVDAGAAFTIAGRMGQGTGAAFVKTGAGLLNLNADNGGTGGWNFNNRATDGFAIQQGVVRWSNANARGLTSNVWTVKDGAALEIANGVNSINLGSGVINLSGSGVGGTGALRAFATSTFASYTTAEVRLVTDAAIGVDSGRLLLPYPILTPSGSTSALIKVGAGTLQLNSSGTSTFNGGTRLLSGTLIVNNATAANQVLGTGGLDVLGGTLEIGQTASTASTLPLVPGANVAMSSGAMNFLVGTTFDKITAGGASTFSLTGGTIGLTLTGSFDPLASYQIMQGFASGVVSDLTFSGTFWDPAVYTPSLSTGGVLSFTAVPEPSSLALLGAAAVVGVMANRRRRTPAEG